MSTLAVIPARLGSTRLPKKPLRLLAGAPLVVRVWERVLDAGMFDRVVVAADAPEVADACRMHGAEVVLTSPDHVSGTDRVAEVARLAEYARHDVIVNVQGDEPAVPREALRGSAHMVASGDFGIGTAAVHDAPAVLADVNVVKVVTDDAGRALYFSRAPIPFLRDAADAGLHVRTVKRHLGVYAFRRDVLLRFVSLPPHPLELIERLEQLRALAAGIAIGVVTVGAPAFGGIDTEEDLAVANARWADHIHH